MKKRNEKQKLPKIRKISAKIVNARKDSIVANICPDATTRKLEEYLRSAVRYSVFSLSESKGLELLKSGEKHLVRYRAVQVQLQDHLIALPVLPIDIFSDLRSAQNALQSRKKIAGKNPQLVRDKFIIELCAIAHVAFNYPIITTVKRDYNGPSAEVITFINDVFFKVREKCLPKLKLQKEQRQRADQFWVDVEYSSIASRVQKAKNTSEFGENYPPDYLQLANALKHELTLSQNQH